MDPVVLVVLLLLVLVVVVSFSRSFRFIIYIYIYRIVVTVHGRMLWWWFVLFVSPPWFVPCEMVRRWNSGLGPESHVRRNTANKRVSTLQRLNVCLHFLPHAPQNIQFTVVRTPEWLVSPRGNSRNEYGV